MSERVRKISSHLLKGVNSTSVEDPILNGHPDPCLSFMNTNENDLTSQFDTDGYVIIRGLLSLEEVETFKNRFKQIIEKDIEIEGMVRMKDIALVRKLKSIDNQEITHPTSRVYKIQDFQNDERLMRYPTNSKVIENVTKFIGENIRSIHTMIINKPPDLGTTTSRHPIHQDLLYFPIRPSNGVIGVWTALEDTNSNNGCLYVLPGSHKSGLFPHDKDPGGNSGYTGVKASIVAKSLEKYKKVECPMKPGDTIFFHPCLLHGSGPNFSQGSRMAISCHYANGGCHFLPKLPRHNWSLLDQVIEVPLKKRIGESASEVLASLSNEFKLTIYKAHWKKKSRQLVGKDFDQWNLSPEEESIFVSNQVEA